MFSVCKVTTEMLQLTPLATLIQEWLRPWSGCQLLWIIWGRWSL